MLDLVHLAHLPQTKQAHDAVLSEVQTGLKEIGFVTHEF